MSESYSPACLKINVARSEHFAHSVICVKEKYSSLVYLCGTETVRVFDLFRNVFLYMRDYETAYLQAVMSDGRSGKSRIST